MAATHFKLNTGAEIPALGFGTWQSPKGETKKAVAYALSVGYTHIDCAYCYGNEDEVGEGLKEAFDSGIKREDIFVTTKLWCTYHSRVEENLDKSLKSLGLDYVDLYLMHWPVAMNPFGNDERFPKLVDGSRDLIREHSHIQTWKSMEKLLATGKVKAIGVANYSLRYLKQLLPEATTVPAVNQIENHPSLPQQEIVDFCHEKGIHVTAYSPLGSTGSPMMKEPAVIKVAENKGVTPACVLLSYHIARGNSVLSKSITPERIKANMQIVKLDEGDMKILDDYTAELTKQGKLTRYVYPAFGVDFGFPDKS
ncbi:Aldo/keto reductase [Hyaloscypha bicolor E]|uniref:Aldo/keto reductase n=1 Tax=Hyaloscypha bicolor E TaxID=1095630 RepID=A0A2J6STN3_9HELO|nr:Aldo/keto reductase [Hyaloscypha bicolor E]PMD54148.1 Aldo/keto reductase [Hyaloscypha bicolor E]